MADVFDYLAWRGDIPFSLDPFNRIDNLLLTLMSYIDYEGILKEDPDCWMTIREISERYFKLHTEEEIQARGMIYRIAPTLLPVMAESPRFSDIQMGNYVNLVGYTPDEQFSAVTLIPGDGPVFAAFRGTDESIAGWREDFTFSFRTCTAGQKYAAEYLNRYFREDTRKIRVGGHSKGGNFAVYASSFCDSGIQDRIIEVCSYDGPGFMEEVTRQPGYERILPRVKSFVPE